MYSDLYQRLYANEVYPQRGSQLELITQFRSQLWWALTFDINDATIEEVTNSVLINELVRHIASLQSVMYAETEQERVEWM